jgi:hypothetical protein|tara:strand:- start:3159 stop:3650 length:492 start_codon:yes stop_codon:yes gene_type:complete
VAILSKVGLEDVVCNFAGDGDPDDRDVHDPKVLVGATHCSQPERDRLAKIEAWGLTDVFRRLHDGDKMYSWWNYRGGDFHQGRWMHIGLLMCSPSVVDRRRVDLGRPQRTQRPAAERPRARHRRHRRGLTPARWCGPLVSGNPMNPKTLGSRVSRALLWLMRG